MIQRAARRLETSLLPYSRQSLPRPARLYSTPTNRTNAPAFATQRSAPPPDIPAFIPLAQKQAADHAGLSSDMKTFLGRRTPYTILPTPLPDDRTSPVHQLYFPKSPIQDLVSVIDACLHNLYDVPRAKQIFDRLRDTSVGDSMLDPRMYNSFLQAYVELATKEPDSRITWIQEACDLFNAMEKGTEKVSPTPGTYAIMLLAWLRFNPGSDTPVEIPSMRNPTTLLTNIIDRQISVSLVVSDRIFTSSEDAAEVIRLLSKSALELNLYPIVSELGQAEAIGRAYIDPLEDVPEVQPVLRIKPREDAAAKQSQDGTPKASETSPEYEVPFNLNNLRKHLAQMALARRVLPEDVAARQKLLEETVYDVAVERWKHQSELFEELGLGKAGLKQADLQRWMWDWHQKLKIRLEAEINDVIAHEKILSPNVTRLAPFLSLVNPEKLSLITILEIMRLQGSGGVLQGMKTTRALLSVGKAVEAEYKAQMYRKNNIPIPSHPRTGEQGYFTRLGYRDLHACRVEARKFMENAEEWTSDWTHLLRIRVGSILVNCLMDVSTVKRTGTDKRTNETVSEVQPAFFHGYEYIRGQKLGVIRLNPVVAERFAKDDLQETLHPRHLPMLVKPKPWVSHDLGGYLFNKTPVMRYKDSQEQLMYLKHASVLGNVELVYAGLDVLGGTPWKINRRVFDVVLQVWNSGERFAKIPPSAYDSPEPVKPPTYETDLKVRSAYLLRQKIYVQNRSNNHSERCNVNYKIEMARAFLGDVFYQPHNIDFRGRAYPIPPHLNHIGDDLSRGLLMFGEAKPLGERGLRWLKIHLANLAGCDKASFDERVSFVHQHLREIYDSAERPLEGARWWLKADDPWQCLATCFELREALESGDPHRFMSYLPVHQDGTCNGLQHYAALGGDDQGARQVNLSVTDRPSDVYTFVAEMVEQRLRSDMGKGEKWAEMLAGKVSRKVVKQTVMTTVYGVTFIGARAQIEKQLKDRADIPHEECWVAASYLAKIVLACIGDLFSGAKSIQMWLNLCARLISKSIPEDRVAEATQPYVARRQKKTSPADRTTKEQMTSVVWTTPLGLPIVQPYRKVKRKQIITALQTVYITDPNSPAEVNSQKQASAFPPNFIHSLDATHMMLTALECRTKGLTFAAVHDSYWTHAASIDEMSTIIRDTFIALHSSDVLGKLLTEFHERYKGYKVPLAHLKRGLLLKQLRAAGSSFSIELAEVTSDKDNTSATSTTSADSETLSEGDDDLESESESDEDVQSITPPKRGKKVKKLDTDEALLGRFAELTDLLPPLPKKGNFNVETIKGSQYFFS